MPNKKKPHLKMWEAINDFLIKTSQIMDLEDYYQQILKEFKKIIPYQAAHIIIHKNIEDRFSKFITVNIPSETVQSYIEYYQFIDKLKEKTFDSTNPIKSTQIMDYSEWKHTEYFSDFLQANNYYYLCGTDVHYQKELLITISLIRNQKSSDFNEEELLYLKTLEPHIANQAYSLIIANISNSFSPNLIAQKLNNNLQSYDLSQRELEVAKLIIKGLTNQQIAAELFISINTVKKHLYKIFNKTKVNSKGELISKLLDI
ncbi:LuxR C-terminal-related transcriptional regulator [Fuchsiella alkaliacetigena]|uniref:LuxR C-terminal-related transcriptional regulator n=1 Tax=Fuchsiella alkaliacetigena TaxID=957042 RepID=UPI00200B9C8C|nr:LuxR C-terminal-related transcriptional regulator [Fuchsiella alkaliacetigena]MCK8825419.1 LuxR C-terminal-related transcriptional regulator [Fuchsiella alkaliacetigena]